MRFSEAIDTLLSEFPDLQNPDVTLRKEIFAHFGLAFWTFALVEHSLINTFVFWSVGERFARGELTTRTHWEKCFDDAYEMARKQTFGNLASRVSLIEEFKDLHSDIFEIARLRNYFAHHLMREEAAFFDLDEGSWFLLTKISKARHRANEVEALLKMRLKLMCERMNFPQANEQQMETMIQELLDEARQALASGQAKVGWEQG